MQLIFLMAISFSGVLAAKGSGGDEKLNDDPDSPEYCPHPCEECKRLFDEEMSRSYGGKWIPIGKADDLGNDMYFIVRRRFGKDLYFCRDHFLKGCKLLTSAQKKWYNPTKVICVNEGAEKQKAYSNRKREQKKHMSEEFCKPLAVKISKLEAEERMALAHLDDAKKKLEELVIAANILSKQDKHQSGEILSKLWTNTHDQDHYKIEIKVRASDVNYIRERLKLERAKQIPGSNLQNKVHSKHGRMVQKPKLRRDNRVPTWDPYAECGHFDSDSDSGIDTFAPVPDQHAKKRKENAAPTSAAPTSEARQDTDEKEPDVAAVRLGGLSTEPAKTPVTPTDRRTSAASRASPSAAADDSALETRKPRKDPPASGSKPLPPVPGSANPVSKDGALDLDALDNIDLEKLKWEELVHHAKKTLQMQLKENSIWFKNKWKLELRNKIKKELKKRRERMMRLDLKTENM